MPAKKYTDKDKKMISSKLRYLRQKFGMSQDEIAGHLGIVRSTYTCYELGITVPDIIMFYKLAGMFGVKMEWFLQESSVES